MSKPEIKRSWNSSFAARRKPMRRAAMAPRKPSDKPRAALPRVGKKGAAWNAERAKLKVRFARIGITLCEMRMGGCIHDNYLGFAHTLKRRNVTDLSRVVLLCQHCHEAAEILTESAMEELLEGIIFARAIQP